MENMAVQLQPVIECAGQDKKKKNRQNRRSKQNPQTAPEISNCSKSGMCLQASPIERSMRSNNTSLADSAVYNLNALNAPSYEQSSVNPTNGLIPMPTNWSNIAEISARNCQDPSTSDSYENCMDRSCTGRFLYSGKMNGLISDNRRDLVNGSGIFERHWPSEAVNEALQKGDAFKAVLRVNAYNRNEGYCSIDGLSVDVLIDGAIAQNRAIAGDTVAIMLDSPAFWPPVKGLTKSSGSSIPVDDDVGYGLLGAVNSREKSGLKSLACEEQIPRTASGSNGQDVSSHVLKEVQAIINEFPTKRPTGKVLAILEKSPRRNTVVGYLSVREFLLSRKGCKKNSGGQQSKEDKQVGHYPSEDCLLLTSTDPRFPKMMVNVSELPSCAKQRLEKGDHSLSLDLMAARIASWREKNFLPHAKILHIFGRSGEIEPEADAIMFENLMYKDFFSAEVLACLPSTPWKIPHDELQRRRDFRDLCIFTIDPSMAAELDDALSVEKISDNMIRVGVHIADVSFFVQPDTVLDKEAKARSASMYLVQHKMPMLPPQLAEDIASLLPGVDRLAMSITWDIDVEGRVADRWIGHSVIHSRVRISYSQVQEIIDGLFLARSSSGPFDMHGLHCSFASEVIESIKHLYHISKKLKENRIRNGALLLGNSKLVFLLNEHGLPYSSLLSDQTDSNYLVEEFMLLANQAAAEVISRAFPDCSLLRRHPEPNLRRMKIFETFCSKHGLELDTSSAFRFHHSLQKLKDGLRDDPVLFDILIYFASKPMQSATYFNSGDLKEKENGWAHYALGFPVYTHFTSPLRRYPDIMVHRALAAVLDAQKMYVLKETQKFRKTEGKGMPGCCFTDTDFCKEIANSIEAKEVLSEAALKYKIPCGEMLTQVAGYLNEKNLAKQHAEEAGTKLFLWSLLKKESLVAEARVLALGPKFMQLYVQRYAIEKRIYYGEVDGLIVDWLEATTTLVLDLSLELLFKRKVRPGRLNNFEDVAVLVHSSYLSFDEALSGDNGCQGMPEAGKFPSVNNTKVVPAVFPLTIQLLSSIPVVVDAIGGVGSPLDIGVKLYLTSYLN